MPSSEVEFVSDSTTDSESAVSKSAEDTETTTIDSIFTASRYGDFEKLRKFVEQDGTSLSSPDNDGNYALHWAAGSDHHEIVQYIVEHGGDVNAVDNDQMTALHWAANIGSISVADVLLQNGAEVEAADANGNRAVHFAAQNGKTTFFNHIVVIYCADFNVPDNDGGRPLHWAVLHNHPEIVQYIIEHGGDVNAVDNTLDTALHWAAIEGSISVADFLLQNGAQVEAVNVDGTRAVHFAAKNGKTSFLNHIVVKYNADFDVPDNEGMTPLHWAACMGFVDTVKCLLSRDASNKRQDMLGRTPLHWAALNGEIKVCKVIINVGTKQDIMVKDNEGNTAIQLASAYRVDYGPLLISNALQAECKHMQKSNIKGKALQKGTKNCPMIIAMQGDAYTGKSFLASSLASKLNCTLISLDDFLVANEPTNKKDTLILHSFNLIAQIVKGQISLGVPIVIDSPLSRLSHLQKIFSVVSTKNTHNTRLLIIECKPENEYAYQLRFEETGSVIYDSSWYKPAAVWPLPKSPKDYTDEDIPYGVSKMVVDTNDYYSSCEILKAAFDVTSCGYGHKTKYDYNWEFIHTDKEEQFTCPCLQCNHKKPYTNLDINFHVLIFYEGRDHCDRLCGVCDNQVYGPRYTCNECPLILHQSCAELAGGEKKHFVPESFPIFLPRDPHLRYSFPIERPCVECRKVGNGFSFKCKYCLFESHLKSRLVPTVVRHKAHNDFLTLFLTSNVDESTVKYRCLACRKYGNFAVYVLNGPQKYHLECALLPPSVHHSHGGYTHDLEMITSRVEKEEDYICDCCSIKMDPSMWYYYCSECNISLHLECAFVDFDSGGPNIEARS